MSDPLCHFVRAAPEWEVGSGLRAGGLPKGGSAGPFLLQVLRLESCPPVSLHTRATSSVCVGVQTKELQKTLRLRHEPRAFTNPALAKSYALGCAKTHYVVMGDCPTFLAVCPADAARLERAGYELMPW